MKRQLIQSSLVTSLTSGLLLATAVFITARYCNRGAIAEEPKSTPSGATEGAKGTTTTASSTSPKQPTQEELEKKFTDCAERRYTTGAFHQYAGRKRRLSQRGQVHDRIGQENAGGRLAVHRRIQYGPHDVTLPLPLRVVWAGDTPVITLDKFPVPGMGSFTARVMIFNDQYAGMWDGGNHGGLLYGKVVKNPQP